MTKQFWWTSCKLGNKVSQRMTKYCTNIGEECSRKLQRFTNIYKSIIIYANNEYSTTLFIWANESFHHFIETILEQKYLCNTPKAKLSYETVQYSYVTQNWIQFSWSTVTVFCSLSNHIFQVSKNIFSYENESHNVEESSNGILEKYSGSPLFLSWIYQQQITDKIDKVELWSTKQVSSRPSCKDFNE